MTIWNVSGFIEIHQNDKIYVSGVANISQELKNRFNHNLSTFGDHGFRKVRETPVWIYIKFFIKQVASFIFRKKRLFLSELLHKLPCLNNWGNNKKQHKRHSYPRLWVLGKSEPTTVAIIAINPKLIALS